MTTVGFIGTGKMGGALVRRFAESQPYPLLITDHSTLLLTELQEVTGAAIAKDAREVVGNADVVFLCVKPQHLLELLADIASAVRKDQLFVSIVAGISIATLSEGLPGARIVRVMPNAPAQIGAMAAGYAPGPGVSGEDLDLVRGLLVSAGIAVQVLEPQLDAVTALSGSGPAFLARSVDAMIKAAVAEGLSETDARLLAVATLEGTGRLLQKTGMTPSELVTMVASPGGTTEAGLSAMEDEGVDALFKATIRAAAHRSRELGR